MDFSRKGFLDISTIFIKEKPELVQQILSKMLVTDVHHDYLRGLTVYAGYSKEFEPIEEGTMIPHYQVVWDGNKNSLVIVGPSQ